MAHKHDKTAASSAPPKAATKQPKPPSCPPPDSLIRQRRASTTKPAASSERQKGAKEKAAADRHEAAPLTSDEADALFGNKRPPEMPRMFPVAADAAGKKSTAHTGSSDPRPPPPAEVPSKGFTDPETDEDDQTPRNSPTPSLRSSPTVTPRGESRESSSPEALEPPVAPKGESHEPPQPPRERHRARRPSLEAPRPPAILATRGFPEQPPAPRGRRRRRRARQSSPEPQHNPYVHSPEPQHNQSPEPPVTPAPREHREPADEPRGRRKRRRARSPPPEPPVTPAPREHREPADEPRGRRKRRRARSPPPEPPRPPVAPGEHQGLPVDERLARLREDLCEVVERRRSGRLSSPPAAPRESQGPPEARPRGAVLVPWRASEDQRLRQAKTTKVGSLVQDFLLEGHESTSAVQHMGCKSKQATTQLEADLRQMDSEGWELLRMGSYLLTRPQTSNWSPSQRLPSGDVLTLGPAAMARAQITSKLRYHFGEVRSWPPGTHDEWFPLDVRDEMSANVQATEAACGASNPMVNVKARKEQRQSGDLENDADFWGNDPIFESDHDVVGDCKPDFDNAITTFIVRDKNFVQGLDHRWCHRDGQGITLAELLLQFKDTHTYEQLYFSWLSCKLLIRPRLGWGTLVFFPSHVACCTASLTWSGLHFSQVLDIQVSVAPMWR